MAVGLAGFVEDAIFGGLKEHPERELVGGLRADEAIHDQQSQPIDMPAQVLTEEVDGAGDDA